MDQCGYNNDLYNKWRLTLVKQLCFKHRQDIITTYVHDITMLLSHNQPHSQCIFSFYTEVQKALGTSLSNNGKEKFYRVLSKLKWKRSKCQLFYLPARLPASFLPINEAHQIIL